VVIALVVRGRVVDREVADDAVPAGDGCVGQEGEYAGLVVAEVRPVDLAAGARLGRYACHVDAELVGLPSVRRPAA
jgi:hypothetical protein